MPFECLTGAFHLDDYCFSVLALLTLPLRTGLSLQSEVLALRHQLTVYQRSGTKPRLRPTDRIF